MRSLLTSIAIVALLCETAAAQFADPFNVRADLQGSDKNEKTLTVSFAVPSGHYLYDHMLDVSASAGVELLLKAKPEPVKKVDSFTGESVSVYTHDVHFVYRVKGGSDSIEVTIKYQGCDKTQCFFPQTKSFAFGPPAGESTPGDGTATERKAIPTPSADDWHAVAEQFNQAARTSGYHNPESFLAFLSGVAVGAGSETGNIAEAFAERGVWLSVILIVLGGLALNLTPCVLPMIPINLAIIGAGTQAMQVADGNGAPTRAARLRGLALGATYGAGIAAVYGLLGLAAVLTGARFGSINSSPWFNAAIAVVFAILSLSMFGVFNLDFTRFQGKMGSAPTKKGSFVTAFGMGGVAALLAGACVAPVVISVLLLSTDLYQKGHAAALALPFVLGVGMALPWPFAGAGLSFLPKPGGWMERVKHVFGVLILLAAIYYGSTSYKIFANHADSSSFKDDLAAALTTGRPVLLDFWASWCKNCGKMEKATFADPEVEASLRDYVLVKYRAEDMNAPETKQVLDYYGVLGLPTYIVLEPKTGR